MGREGAPQPAADLTGAAGAVLVRGAPGAPPPWAARLDPLPEVVLGPRPAAAARVALAGAACGVVDGAEADAMGVLRRAYAADPTLQVVLVAPPEIRARLQHTLLLTPGVGEVWLTTPEELHPDLLERARAVTGQRRRYQKVRAGIERGMADAPPPRARRALISDAFLANLLQTVPDPVLSIDAAGTVLSWNPAAERVLGYTQGEAVGRDLRALLAVGSPGPLGRLMEEALTHAAQGEVPFRRRGGEVGVGEVAITPVLAAGEGIRSVILHDLTEERRVQAELETQAAQLQEQAAELELLNDELQERARELEGAMATRSRFYASMSHELRTPINAIIGYNALLLDGIFGPLPERQADGLRRAQRAAQHLLELVNDVLDLAKIEAGRIEVTPEVTEFPALLEELLDTVRSLAGQHGSELFLDRGSEAHAVLSDPRRVRQILLNLLSNAIKFGEGKPIRVEWARTAEGGVKVHVVDQGRGIAPADLARIFDEFEQVEPRPGSGTGLGLPISLRLARLLGGDLRVRSAPGAGSTFTLVLPPILPGEVPGEGGSPA